MSDRPAIRCDICDAIAPCLTPGGGRAVTAPDGWGWIRVGRREPFICADRDLCPTCFERVLQATQRKAT